MQERQLRGDIVEVLPYKPERRLHNHNSVSSER
jgi:hypothetical protein